MSREEKDIMSELKGYMYDTVKRAKIGEEDRELLIILTQDFISIFTSALYESKGLYYF